MLVQALVLKIYRPEVHSVPLASQVSVLTYKNLQTIILLLNLKTASNFKKINYLIDVNTD